MKWRGRARREKQEQHIVMLGRIPPLTNQRAVIKLRGIWYLYTLRYKTKTSVDTGRGWWRDVPEDDHPEVNTTTVPGLPFGITVQEKGKQLSKKELKRRGLKNDPLTEHSAYV